MIFESDKWKAKVKKNWKAEILFLSFFITFSHVFTIPLHEQLKNVISSSRLHYDSLSW